MCACQLCDASKNSAVSSRDDNAASRSSNTVCACHADASGFQDVVICRFDCCVQWNRLARQDRAVEASIGRNFDESNVRWHFIPHLDCQQITRYDLNSWNMLKLAITDDGTVFGKHGCDR